jgi:hypothetical protein
MLHEHLPETGGMRRGQTNIFVEVKDFDLRPFDARFFREPIQEFQLRCRRCGDDPGFATFRDRAPYRSRSVVGSRANQRDFVSK